MEEQEFNGSPEDPPTLIGFMFPREVLLWNEVHDDDESFWGEVRISTRDAVRSPAMSDPTFVWGYSGEHRMIEAIVYLVRNGIKYTIVRDDPEDFKAWPVSDGWSDCW